MSLDPAAGRRSASPESSGRDSPLPRQWRNQLGGEDVHIKDKSYRKYAAGVDRALSLFETALQEWADYISFLNRLLKALQARPSSATTIPAKVTVAKRLSQCLKPSLPSGVHQKTLEVYNYVFAVIGKDNLSRDLPLYLPGLAPTLSFASLSVRSPFLDLLEKHFLGLDPRALRPAMKSLILALLPGLEEESSEDFDRTLKLLENFKMAARGPESQELTETHATGDDYFWQCFFLGSITSQSRRPGALAYLVRHLPRLTQNEPGKPQDMKNGEASGWMKRLVAVVTSPEPGLLLRCFAAGLADEQLLIQRGFLDLLVTHLPLHSDVLQKQAKPQDLGLLLKAAAGVVIRRDMSLNRRLWSWLLGPEPALGDLDAGPESPASPSDPTSYFSSKTNYFEEFGLQPLVKALLAMVTSTPEASPAERARPYRICLSLMDRWEIGGLIVPEVFLPVVDSVRKYKAQAPRKADFAEVLRSASMFFDGVESGLIYGEMVALLAQAIGSGDLDAEQRRDKLSLVSFILSNFNVREEEMITVHAPLVGFTSLCMLEDAKERRSASSGHSTTSAPVAEVMNIASSLLELVPERAFPADTSGSKQRRLEPEVLRSLPNMEILKRIKAFYVNEQGNLDSSSPPFTALEVGELLLRKTTGFVCERMTGPGAGVDSSTRIRLLVLLLTKLPAAYQIEDRRLLAFLHEQLQAPGHLPFASFASMLSLSTNLYTGNRITPGNLSDLTIPLVRRAWSYLAASEPKYHVETVRCLWQLQSSLSPLNREIEAAIAGLMTENDTSGTYATRPADPGRTFAILWSHSLQDHPHADRRGSKTPFLEYKTLPRLSGMDHYKVMLTRPLFLMLDALLDEKTQLFMTTKAWLNSLVGVDKLFQILATSFCKLPFLAKSRDQSGDGVFATIKFDEDDDLDLCLYYLRTLSNILKWAPDAFWETLFKQSVSLDDIEASTSVMTGTEEDMALHEFFFKVCMACVKGDGDVDQRQMRVRLTQLHRCALTVLHQLLLSPAARQLVDVRLANTLIERLSDSLDGPDPYTQVLLLDVVYATLRLREEPAAERPLSPGDKKPPPMDPNRVSQLSITTEPRPRIPPPPPGLLKCLRAGISSLNSRPVLESWVHFLTECLPLYSDSIFQVLIPLVETFCKQIGRTIGDLKVTFSDDGNTDSVASAPETTLISLLNGLERVLARAHDQLLEEESRNQALKSPDQPQGFFGNMVSGVFTSDAPQSRSATANDRLTVYLAFQDAVRICFQIWSWGQGDEATRQDPTSSASFNYTSLRMRNRARRLLEHLFAAETLECLETVIDIWRNPATGGKPQNSQVLDLLSALDGSRPKHTIPAIFNAIYSRTNPGALEPSRKSTLTISLPDTDLVVFLVEYARSLEDDAMDEIWHDCMVFLKDLLGNPFPHRQTLPCLLEFAAVLGEKVDNTNFGEQRKMRRELGDLFLRLLTALFTTKPITFSDSSAVQGEKTRGELVRRGTMDGPAERAEDVVGVLASIVPSLPKILLESDRVLSAAGAISANVIGPTLRSKAFPDTVSQSTLLLLQELARLPNNQKTWKKDVGDAFNDARFFASRVGLVREDWLPLLRQWTMSDKERMLEIVGRISPPSTAGIVFGVGATSARLEADRKTQLNLRRIATLVLASAEDTFVADIPVIFEKLVELLAATATSSPSSTTRAEIFMVIRALVLQNNPFHLAMLWPVVNAELHAAVASVVAADHSTASDTYNNASILQACKLLDLLICLAPDDFQLHEWLFVTDTIDAVYRSSSFQPVALVDEISEDLGSVAMLNAAAQAEAPAQLAANSSHKRPLLGPGGISDEVGLERKDELVAKVLRPFFGQLSIFSFESTYAMGSVDREFCVQGLLRDLFDERSIVKAL